jgi:aminopeptidase YwaD
MIKVFSAHLELPRGNFNTNNFGMGKQMAIYPKRTRRNGGRRRANFRTPQCQPKRIWRDWEVLCRDIGERRAGTKGEKAAAQYILEQFQNSGLQPARLEPFPCVSLRKSRVELRVERVGRWRSIPARAIVGAPGTHREVTGDLVWVEMPEQARNCFANGVRGKVVVLFGPLPNDPALHRELVAHEPAAVIHVDDRLPFDWLKDDGVYPLWATKFGMPPTISIPFRTAWDLKKEGATRARVRVRVDQHQAESQNVVGEIEGSRPNLPLIVVSAHHDTQCNNVGADDNGSGVVAVLELARMFAQQQPLRTIRFISFGTEEQLSVGSTHYVQAHRGELAKIGAILNMDGISSVLGHNVVLRAGENRFGEFVMSTLVKAGFYAKELTDAFPYADHFPFAAFGIPAITMSRPNMNSFMRWQHHSIHDNLDEISLDEAAKAASGLAAVLSVLANSAQWPFSRGLPEPQRTQTRNYARDLFGLKV